MITPEILNAAMCAYIVTFPSRDRLRCHLEKAGLIEHGMEIEAHLDAVIKTAENYLWNYPGGVPWSDTFEEAYRAMLSDAYPWLDSAALIKILSFSNWYCWHEGLNSE